MCATSRYRAARASAQVWQNSSGRPLKRGGSSTSGTYLATRLNASRNVPCVHPCKDMRSWIGTGKHAVRCCTAASKLLSVSSSQGANASVIALVLNELIDICV